MRIAILVWGSLYWDPRNLEYTGEWHFDGPLLPIEFARISRGNRITLVIKPGYPLVPTLYCISQHTTLQNARENLRLREDTTNIDNIGFLDFISRTHRMRPNNFFMLDVITRWNHEKGFDAIIWSDFAPNFQDTLNVPLSSENAAAFVSNLAPGDREQAKDYIEKAPGQIQTRHRQEIEAILNAAR